RGRDRADYGNGPRQDDADRGEIAGRIDRLLRRLVAAVRDRGFGRLEADARVGAVAERLVGRAAAAAQRERPLRDLIFVAVPVDELHVVAVDAIRAVLPHRNRRHPLSSATPSSAW